MFEGGTSLMLKCELTVNYAKCTGCRLCESAVCPVEAISTHPDNGSRVVNENRCIGCNSCAFVCPFGAILVDRSVGRAFVCDRCDGDPLCVRFCPWEAIEFVPSDDVSMKLKRDSARKLVDLLDSNFNECAD